MPDFPHGLRAPGGARPPPRAGCPLSFARRSHPRPAPASQGGLNTRGCSDTLQLGATCDSRTLSLSNLEDVGSGPPNVLREAVVTADDQPLSPRRGQRPLGRRGRADSSMRSLGHSRWRRRLGYDTPVAFSSTFRGWSRYQACFGSGHWVRSYFRRSRSPASGSPPCVTPVSSCKISWVFGAMRVAELGGQRDRPRPARCCAANLACAEDQVDSPRRRWRMIVVVGGPAPCRVCTPDCRWAMGAQHL